METPSTFHQPFVTSNNLFDQLPFEILEFLFSFVPFKQSCNLSLSSRSLFSAFLNNFRRVLRESLNNYNNYLNDKFEIFECGDDEYLERYKQEFAKIQDKFNCKIPFIVKELLMITKHIDAEMDTSDHYSELYPVHWINPIKTWKKEGHIVKIGSSLALVPNGEYNNLIIRTGQHYVAKVDLWHSLFNPQSYLFKIEGDSFPKYCSMMCGRELTARIENITSSPLALCLLNNFTTKDISPQQIAKVIQIISKQLWNDKDFLVKAAKIYYKIGKEIPTGILEDRGFCVRLVKSHGKMLKYCTRFLQDIELVTHAVKQNGFSIKYLSSQFLRTHPQLFELAVSSKPYSLYHISNSAPDYRNLVIKGLKQLEQIHTIPKFIMNDDSLQDKEIVEIILMKNPILIEHMPKVWQECRPLAKKLFTLLPLSITYFPPKIKQDPRILKMVSQTKPSLILHIIPEIDKQKDCLFNAWGLPHINHNNYDEIMTQIVQLVKKNPDIYEVVLTSKVFDNNWDQSVNQKWCTIIFLEGVSQNPRLITAPRLTKVIPRLSVNEQEDILRAFLNNPVSVSANYFNEFNNVLVKKYELDALKKCVRLSDFSFVLATSPDDIVECFKFSESEYSTLCLSEEEYKSKESSEILNSFI